MKVYRCDRCGKYYEHQRDLDQLSLDGTMSVLTGRGPAKELDICDVCFVSLSKVLMEWWNLPRE